MLLAVLGVGSWLAWALWLPVTPEGQKFVMLRPGYSTRRIAAELQSAGVIRSQLAFILWHRFHQNKSLKAGEYLFEKTARTVDVHSRLVRGDIYVHTVVIPEGYTVFDLTAGYRWRFLELLLSVQNLFNATWREAQFATVSRLPGEPPAGVNDINYTPGAPINVTATGIVYF